MTHSSSSQGNGIRILGVTSPIHHSVLHQDALVFLSELHRRFNVRRKKLLTKRQEVQTELDNGQLPNFFEHTKDIRKKEWQVAPLPEDLLDRRVEITGPVDRKMIINALNSGAKVFMADFEDSNSPTWSNIIDGQVNLRDANLRNITYSNPKNGKFYQLNDTVATLMVRPRGWHLDECHLECDGEVMSGSLVDFGLYFYNNHKQLLVNNSGPYFYLPKLEHYEEARLWNDVFLFAQQYVGIPTGTIKATVLIETILASFQLHEILFELKEHSAGLNCGRWDYIFSFIKRFRNLDGYILPDRAKVGMTTHFMRSYSQLVIQTCHKRGVHAMGGMAAQIPIKNDPEANEKAINKVKNDKSREVKDGHDGTWVAHPGLVRLAMDIFDEHMPQDNQIENKRDDISISASDLIKIPQGDITENGIRENINVGILYTESWLRGIGAAAIYHLMEDAATAEISRSQLWQWLHNQIRLSNGQQFTFDLYEKLLQEEIQKIKEYVGIDYYNKGRFEEAIEIFNQLIRQKDFKEFLTLPAYKLIQT